MIRTTTDRSRATVFGHEPDARLAANAWKVERPQREAGRTTDLKPTEGG